MDFDIRQYHADQKHQHFDRVLKLSVSQNGIKQFRDDQFEFFKLIINNSCSIKEKEQLEYNICIDGTLLNLNLARIQSEIHVKIRLAPHPTPFANFIS